jgi:hypothetical protein
LIHLYPLADAQEHDLSGTVCECQPDVDWETADPLVTHKPFDKREPLKVKLDDEHGRVIVLTPPDLQTKCGPWEFLEEKTDEQDEPTV